MSQTTPKRRYGLYSLAILLLLVAIVALYLGSDYPTVEPVAGVAIIAGVYLLRISKSRPQQTLAIVTVPGADSKAEERLRRRLWIASIALVPFFGGAYVLMYIDSVNGSHEGWPLYVFVGVGFVCTIVWSYLAAKIFGSQ
jgi:hypothetical protein